MLGEKILQIVFCDVVGEVSYEQLRIHSLTLTLEGCFFFSLSRPWEWITESFLLEFSQRYFTKHILNYLRLLSHGLKKAIPYFLALSLRIFQADSPLMSSAIIEFTS